MATPGKVANRYAKALFDELKGKKSAETVLKELEDFAGLVKGHKELSFLVSCPGFSVGQKADVVGDLAEKAKVSKEAAKILTGITRMGRIDQLDGILQRLKVKLLQSEGVQPIRVWTAEVLGADEKKAIEKRFADVLGKKVEATYESSPDLVGGLRVIAGGRTYDGSILGWLDSLEENLVEGEM